MFAVCQVQRFGGVLEHPAASTLWRAAFLPRPGESADELGGYSVEVCQSWYGHKAEKRTWLYIVGACVPGIQLGLLEPTHYVTNRHGIRRGHEAYKPELARADREHTPPAFAEFLVSLARGCCVE
jgi:hypothetical protein